MATTDDDVSRDVENWPDEVLECRSLQHAWQGRSAAYSSKYRYYRILLTCGRCGTVKTQELDVHGYILASWYSYPEGYLSHTGRMTASRMATIRLASVQRGEVGRTSNGRARGSKR